MIQRFLRHKIIVRRLVTDDSFSGSVYEDSVEIMARFSDSSSLIRDPAGREVISGARVSMVEPISVGDLIRDPTGRDRKVVQVDTAYRSRGRFSHHVAFLS